RPFLELPPAFLWAIRSSASGFDRLDLDRRVRLAVAASPAACVLALLERENDDLVAAALLEDGRPHGRAVHGGRAHPDRGAVGDQEHAVEGHNLAVHRFQALDPDHVPDLNAMLLPAGLDEGVHARPLA